MNDTAVFCIFTLLIFVGIAGFDSYRKKRKYASFLSENEAAEFFCYTNRKNSSHYVNTRILPELDKNIHIILLNGKTPVSEFDEKYISQMLYNIEDVGFPNLMKIAKGKVFDISLHDELYNTINQDKPAEEFMAILNQKLGELRRV